MPLYEYNCKKCGANSEFIQKFNDPPMRDCHECGTSGSLEKLMSLGSFHLKGSGWYLTDYARKATPNTSPGSTSSKETCKAEKSNTSADKGQNSGA